MTRIASAKVSISINGGETIVTGYHGEKEASVIGEDEIVLSTKSIMVGDLVGREKQIYDYAYRRGSFEKEMKVLEKRQIAILFIVFGIALAAILIIGVFRHP